MLRVGYHSYVYKLSVSDQAEPEALTPSVRRLPDHQRDCDSNVQVEAGSDAPSEAKVDQRAALPAENGLSHTPIIAPKPPSLLAHQPQSAGTELKAIFISTARRYCNFCLKTTIHACFRLIEALREDRRHHPERPHR